MSCCHIGSAGAVEIEADVADRYDIVTGIVNIVYFAAQTVCAQVKQNRERVLLVAYRAGESGMRGIIRCAVSSRYFFEQFFV